MLRLAVLVLLLANLGYYAWTAGHLRGLVSASPTQREPERLQRQVRPEIVQLNGTAPPAPAGEPPATAPASAAMARAAASCLEIGPCTEAGYAGVQSNKSATGLQQVVAQQRASARGAAPPLILRV